MHFCGGGNFFNLGFDYCHSDSTRMDLNKIDPSNITMQLKTRGKKAWWHFQNLPFLDCNSKSVAFEWIWICGFRQSHPSATPFAPPGRPGRASGTKATEASESQPLATPSCQSGRPRPQQWAHQAEHAPTHLGGEQTRALAGGAWKRQQISGNEITVWTPHHRLRH